MLGSPWELSLTAPPTHSAAAWGRTLPGKPRSLSLHPPCCLGRTDKEVDRASAFIKLTRSYSHPPWRNRLRCPCLEANFPPAWTQLLPVLQPLSALSQITLSCFLPYGTGCSRKRTAEPGKWTEPSQRSGRETEARYPSSLILASWCQRVHRTPLTSCRN